MLRQNVRSAVTFLTPSLANLQNHHSNQMRLVCCVLTNWVKAKWANSPFYRVLLHVLVSTMLCVIKAGEMFLIYKKKKKNQ